MKRFLIGIMMIITVVLIFPVCVYATEDPEPYNTEEWFYGDEEESISNIDAFLLEQISLNVEEIQTDTEINPSSLVDPEESIDLEITLPAYSTTYAHTIVGSGATGKNNLGLSEELCLTHWQSNPNCSCTDLVTVHSTVQGACADEEYVYFAFYIYYGNSAGSNETICQKIVCSKINSDGSFDLENATIRTFTNLEHANSMTYNNRTDQVVVAHCKQAVERSDGSGEASEHFEVSTINAAYLRGETEALTHKVHNISCKTTSIDYNQKTNEYIVGLTGKKYSFAILNQDFQVIKTISAGSADSDELWSRQSTWCDGNYIYCAFYYNYSNQTMENAMSAISVIDYDSGTIVKELNFFPSDSNKYEIENLFEINGRLIVSFICIGKGSFYYDLSELTDTFQGENHAATFEVQYYDNTDRTDDVATFMSQDEYDKKKSIVIHGLSTPIQINRFSNTGYKFVGWALYSPASNRWMYVDEDGNRAWRTSPADGETKYLYEDEKNISSTVSAGGVLILCAQWEATTNFYITFFSDNTNNQTATQTCVFGSNNTLRNCTFSSTTGSSFKGWHAYWVEKDKWYYISADGLTKKWFTEGEEDAGYRKYVYSNQQNVIQTATAGGHIEMYAVWNEITVYYYAGAKDITTIKPPLKVNLTSSYFSPEYWRTESIYNLYWLENDQWYYGGWLNFDSTKTKTKYTINSTTTTISTNMIKNQFQPEDSLILCWTEYTPNNFDF